MSNDEVYKKYYKADDNKIKMHNSVVAYIDVLGFSELNKGNKFEAIESFYDAFLQCCYHTGIHTDENIKRVVKIFSDNIMIVYPIENDGEWELSLIFDDLSTIQMTLCSRGFFARGAVTVGEVFIDDITILGPALIEVVESEKKLAVFPRIILTDTAMSLVKSHIDYYKENSTAPQNKLLFKDVDGFFILNYLEQAYIAEEAGEIFYYFIETHKKEIEDNLVKYINDPKIFAKYHWSAKYHNYFCTEYKNLPHLVINMEKYKMTFSKLIN